MEVRFTDDELAEALTVIVNHIANETGLSDKDRAMVKRWRSSKMKLGSDDMDDLVRKANEDFSGLLGAKGIPHSLHVWGFGSKHDWPFWQPMASAYLP
jgi:esterase/lipase superfamily enzyme